MVLIYSSPISIVLPTANFSAVLAMDNRHAAEAMELGAHEVWLAFALLVFGDAAVVHAGRGHGVLMFSLLFSLVTTYSY